MDISFIIIIENMRKNFELNNIPHFYSLSIPFFDLKFKTINFKKLKSSTLS